MFKRCGLVGGSESLWGWALRVYAQTLVSAEETSSWLPLDQDVELSAPFPDHVRLDTAMLPTMMIMD